MENADETFEKNVGERIRRLRIEQALTLDQLADRSGVSRAMISRVERGEANPTAALLARLCSALNMTLSVFFAESQPEVSPLARRAAQPVWRDPESGYLRRVVGPPRVGARIDLVEVEFPPGAEVLFPGRQTNRNQWQHVWLFEGVMELTVGETVHRLEAGDCLFMTVCDVKAFRNPGKMPARYAVVIDPGPR